MNRRDFLLGLAGMAGGAALLPRAGASDSLGAILPTRPLGATGERVTMLGLGGFHIGWTSEALAHATIEAALEEGVRFFDTANNYGQGASEERFGQFLTPRHRDHVFIMTKTQARDAATAREHLDLSRKRMRCDVIDLWQMHALQSPEDVDARIAAGVLDVLLEAQEAGHVRHLGFTGHASPHAHRRIMEVRGDAFAACQFPISPVDAASKHSFVESVLPPATTLSLGVLAMKTLADGRFFAKKDVNGDIKWETDDPLVPDQLSVTDCLHFTWSLPVSVLITGAEKPAFLTDKARACRSFASLTPAERSKIIGRAARFANAGRVEYYKAPGLRS
jgi:uncharacterized protein